MRRLSFAGLPAHSGGSQESISGKSRADVIEIISRQDTVKVVAISGNASQQHDINNEIFKIGKPSGAPTNGANAAAGRR
jgi:hypothetical protein